ncbi:C40 family peptidase [Bacillus sp. RG28]|uniref:C40 family peptidase n=1 Tax=Gottfriedia endophytica TaxID=2820819 RepID=A0A940SI58_9BACI|nr:C40 family peptidase [Gottfriedia endophytica]MBP0724655.1 C40 family peptidase [Gottfriedia endophytica]
MIAKKIAAIALSGALILTIIPFNTAHAESKVAQKQREISNYENQLNTLNNKIEISNQKINSTEKKINNLKDEITKTEQTITKKNERITYLQGRIEKRHEIIQARLKAMQEQPRTNLTTEVLFNSTDIVDFFNRLFSISQLFGADQNIIETQKNEQAEVEVEKKQVIQTQEQLVASKKELINTQSVLVENKKEQQQAANEAQQKLDQAVKALEAAKLNAQKLEQEALRLAELQSNYNAENENKQANEFIQKEKSNEKSHASHITSQDNSSSDQSSSNGSNSNQNDNSSSSDSKSNSNSNSSSDSKPSSDPTPQHGAGGVVEYAMQFMGVPYVFGGTSPSGFDCSGFIWYVYSHNGYSIGRASVNSYWGMVTKVSSPQPGDLVFLQNTYINGPSHMGIYIGGNRMIHAGSSGITTISLSNSWVKSHFLGYGKF